MISSRHAATRPVGRTRAAEITAELRPHVQNDIQDHYLGVTAPYK